MKRFLYILGGLFAFIPTGASAHVRYIADDEAVATFGGMNWQYLLDALTDPQFITIGIVTLAITVGFYFFFHTQKSVKKLVGHIDKTALTYHPLVPWILRIAIGILLIGAGTKGWMLSPVLEVGNFISTIQIALGFMLLAGFLTGPTVLVTIMLFLAGLLQDPYLVGSFEIFAGLVALLILDSRFPGMDDMIGIPDYGHHPSIEKYVPSVLRIGVGVAMVFLAVYEKLLNPVLSAYVVEVTNLANVIPVSEAMWVLGAGLIELLIGILLIINWKPRLTSLIAFLVLTLSFFYFEEDVSSHITLFAVLSIVFIYGRNKFSTTPAK